MNNRRIENAIKQANQCLQCKTKPCMRRMSSRK